jgi:hypothetical protein
MMSIGEALRAKARNTTRRAASACLSEHIAAVKVVLGLYVEATSFGAMTLPFMRLRYPYYHYSSIPHCPKFALDVRGGCGWRSSPVANSLVVKG